MGKRDESYSKGGALHPLDLENQKDINIRKHDNNANKHLGIENSPRVPDKHSSALANVTGEKKQKEDRYDLDKQAAKENFAAIDKNPLGQRIFTHVAQTSTAIQVAWSHPQNF